MKKIFSLIACFSIVAFAQNEQEQFPWQQPQQGQYQQPQQVQCQCHCPQQQQQQYQYQYQYQYPPQQQYSFNSSREKVQMLIEEGVKKNKEEIQKESFSLSPADKRALYNKNKKGVGAAVGSLALNVFPGFGLGNYIQGNTTFGIVQSILDGIGYLLYGIALDSYGSSAEMFITIGSLFIIPSRMAGLIAPFVYQSKYNEALEDALNFPNFSYSIDPLIVPKNGAPAVGLAFNLRY
jgi:hypothetical protein